MDINKREQLAGAGITAGITMGANAILPGLGGLVGPIADSFITPYLENRASARQFTKDANKVGQDTNPYMANGGFIQPASKVWAMYGGEEGRNKLKERMAKGGYLSSDKVTPKDVKKMQEDLLSKGYNIGKVDGVPGKKTLSALIVEDTPKATDDTTFVSDNELTNIGEGTSMRQVEKRYDRAMNAKEIAPNVYMRSTRAVEMMEDGGEIKNYTEEQLMSVLQQLEADDSEEAQQMVQLIKQELQSRSMPDQMMKYGGAIVGIPKLAEYIGPSHANGGILVDSKGRPTNEANAAAEVEGGEVVWNNKKTTYIFSDNEDMVI